MGQARQGGRGAVLAAWAVALAAAGVLAGCAAYAPRHLQAGSTEADVRAEMGAPTAVYELGGGARRLEYARGPYGKDTYMVDLDPGGRVTGWRDVMNEAEFAQVHPGETREELLRQIGHPADVRSGDWQGGQVWSYRYPTDMGLCQWFQVSIDDHGVVGSSGYGIDPRCDVNDRNFPER